MKKADNFDASKWLTENKITKQSRLNEMATMIKKNSPFGSEKPLQVGDTIMWKTYSNDDRGMGSSVSGRLIGKVVKILGTANLQAEDIKTGDLYKVSRTELTRVPNVGDKIEATLSYNSGAGSGSQGSNKISGIVKKVNPEKFSMIIQTENSDKPTILDLKDLSDVKIYGLNESRLNEAKVIDTKSNDFVQVRLYTPNDGNVVINKKAFVNYLTGKVSKEYKEELRDFIKYEFPDFLNNFEEELHDSSYEPFPSNQDVINQLEEAFSYFCTSRPDEFYNLVKQEDEL